MTDHNLTAETAAIAEAARELVRLSERAEAMQAEGGWTNEGLSDAHGKVMRAREALRNLVRAEQDAKP